MGHVSDRPSHNRSLSLSHTHTTRTQTPTNAHTHTPAQDPSSRATHPGVSAIKLQPIALGLSFLQSRISIVDLVL